MRFHKHDVVCLVEARANVERVKGLIIFVATSIEVGNGLRSPLLAYRESS